MIGHDYLGVQVRYHLEEKMIRKLLCSIGLTLILVMIASAQQGSTGAITGTVFDPSGQVVPGATVKLTFELNGDTHTGTTNESGDFSFQALTPGAYTVRVDAPGF